MPFTCTRRRPGAPSQGLSSSWLTVHSGSAPWLYDSSLISNNCILKVSPAWGAWRNEFGVKFCTNFKLLYLDLLSSVLLHSKFLPTIISASQAQRRDPSCFAIMAPASGHQQSGECHIQNAKYATTLTLVHSAELVHNLAYLCFILVHIECMLVHIFE